MKKHIVKEYFTEALLELLKKKPFDKITISDLVKKSGASRASFYRNYTSKEDIVDEYLAAIFSDTFAKHQIDAQNIRFQVCSVFSEIYQYREQLKIIGKAGLLERIDRFMYQETLARIEQIGVMNNRYQPHFFAGAASALIKAWVEYGFEETPEQICEIFFRSLSGYMSY